MHLCDFLMRSISITELFPSVAKVLVRILITNNIIIMYFYVCIYCLNASRTFYFFAVDSVDRPDVLACPSLLLNTCLLNLLLCIVLDARASCITTSINPSLPRIFLLYPTSSNLRYTRIINGAQKKIYVND